jgi:NADH-ubiquinone oxidoreductase chain 1
MKTMINNDSMIVVYSILLDLLDILVVLLPILLSVAFVTIVERKVLAAMQRRVGPNTTG